MASIAQKRLFGWEQVEEVGDLKRLGLLLEHIPDEALMQVLEAERGRGRDEYPVRPMWNALLAGVVFQHPTVESLLREMRRNGQLRQVCGFEVEKGLGAVPPSWAFSRFVARVLDHLQSVQGMFEVLVEQVAEVLPGYGEGLAVDGKGIASWAAGVREGETKKQKPGRRRETDAAWGVHEYSGIKEDGTAWTTVKRWFGYTLHLVVATGSELPVAFSVTKANASEVVEAHKLVERIGQEHPKIAERCQRFIGDRSYDDTKLLQKVWEEWEALPIIEIRNCWKDGEKSRIVEGMENVIYDYRGTVSCVCPKTGTEREMAYGGFERDRETLKYRCPAEHYGYACAGRQSCPIGKAVRVPRAEEPRIFTPLPRPTMKWDRLYNERTAVERVNSRLDVSFGFENHTIRGLKKMRTRCALALTVMLAMAVGRIKADHAEAMRSLIKTA